MRQIFHALPWIPPAEPEPLRKIYLEYGIPISFKKGELMKAKGEKNRLYFIQEGLAAYFIADSFKSHASILNLLPPGRTACDLSALLALRVNIVTRALTDCKVLSVPPHIVRKLMEEDGPLAVLVAGHVLQKSECSIEAMVANFTLAPKQRLATFLRVLFQSSGKEVKEGWNEIPITLTAEQYGLIVNLTRVSVSRFFSEWIEEGLMKKEGRRIFVVQAIFSEVWDWLGNREMPEVYTALQNS